MSFFGGLHMRTCISTPKLLVALQLLFLLYSLYNTERFTMAECGQGALGLPCTTPGTVL